MPKLPKGMFKRGRSYYVRDRLNGRDRWRSLGANYSNAVTQMRKLQAGDINVKGDRITVFKAAEKWLHTRVKTGRNLKGQRLADYRVRTYLVPFMGHFLINKLQRDDLREYRLWLERKCKTPTTVRHILGDARNLLYWCEETGLVDRALIPRGLMPRLQERPPDRLDTGEIEILRCLPDPHGFVIRFGLGTGLRWSELCRAQARHLQNGVLVISHTKSKKVRRIPLRPELLKELRTRVGKLVPFSEKSPGSFAKAIRKQTAIKGFHVHQMRHTFACLWLERGGSMAALKELMGHSSIVTTERYARLSDDLVKRESERLERC